MSKSGRWLREPLVHFFVLGLGLFVLFAQLNADSFQAPNEIVVDGGRIAALEARFQRTWQRPPTADELSGIVDAWVREEVLYREGIALGLDQDDPIVRQRIALKMRFMADSLVDDELSDPEVEAFFADNLERYRKGPRYSLRQVYFDPARHGSGLARVMADAREALMTNPAAASGDSTLLPPALQNESGSNVARIFGIDFAAALETLPLGEWAGPVESAYGVHLVYLDERESARNPALDEVRVSVERDLLEERSASAEDELYQLLRERYTVRFVDGPGSAGDAATEETRP